MSERTVGNGAGDPPIVAVVGPTAAGKTALGVALARALGGEVVNGDSMQVYRGMDIGTAKASPAERGGVPHHLLDILDPAEVASVAVFQQLARDAIDDCLGRGVTPVLVGGSALYVRAVLDRFEFPGTDPGVRARWEARLAAEGPDVLFRRLSEVDPAAAQRIGPGNGRRLVRALEVNELTGEPFRATLPAHEFARPDTVMLGLDVPRPVLDRRIEQRVAAMMAAGFLDEVRGLRERGLAAAPTASRALGYSAMLGVLDGALTLDGAVAATVTATRRFARRQDSWFRRDPRIHWLPYDADDLLERALAVLEHAVGAQALPRMER